MEPMTMMAAATALSSLLGLGGSLMGNKNQLQKIPTKTKQQQSFQQGLLNQAMGMQQGGGGFQNAMNLLQGYLNPQSDVYKDFEAPYLQQFEQQIIPRLAEKFAGMGATSGALSSSGFGQALGGAGADLQAKLAGLKSGMQQQSIGQLLQQFNQLSNMGLADQFAYASQPGGGGFLGGAGTSMAQSLPMLMMMMNHGQGGGSGGGGGMSPPVYGSMSTPSYAANVAGRGVGGFGGF